MTPIMPLQAVSQYLSNLRDRNLKFTMDLMKTINRSQEVSMYVDVMKDYLLMK
ncbi:hypothetical protein [Solobacterium moorei]|uniref:Uncharacterized protein n=1 Tax=Solobacterium moorei F0204 TaxID=706433 RepID=E7MNI0_9FIRM|nr:hypothetical protein [Solobacterium moorei]EFW24318.1 hypothetical protein HMPREF9430_01100 [Solobacterium moorei F0204]